MKRDFLALEDYSAKELQELVALALKMKSEPQKFSESLKSKTLGMLFNKRSTRTRISFEVGMLQLGGCALFFSPNDTQLSRGESIPDTARVLSGYLNGIMVRTYAHEDIVELAKYASIPVINGLTDYNHPCQAMSDILTLRERFGDIAGRKLVYMGDSNNMTVSLMAACLKFGMHMTVISPGDYSLEPRLAQAAIEKAQQQNLKLQLTDQVEEGVKDADVIYTDTWTSMGQEEEYEKRLKDLEGYQVDDRVMTAARPDAVFMHCLPAHRGEEVTASVIDGPQSVVWEQAENRLHMQKAILHTLLK